MISLLQRNLPDVGEWLRQHKNILQRAQIVVVLVYVALLALPLLVELPGREAHILNNIVVFAQFMFWGIWWPFVLISMVLFGRFWCGVLCPEGALTEWASRHGRHKSIPKWLRWGGWPFVAFAGTTIYGQMVSVYQYPAAAALVLGGSTIAAMGIGFLYAKEKRVWCRYLCPVNGVFRMLAKLSPLSFQVDTEAWSNYKRPAGAVRIAAPNCAPLVAIHKMHGASDCHMCGRCSGYRDAVVLKGRPFGQEVIVLGKECTRAESIMILFGMIGMAMGAFHWSASPLFVDIKQYFATFLVQSDILWPLETTTPWWIFTNYPAQNDVFSLLDGFLLIAYIITTGLVVGGALTLCVGTATRALKPFKPGVFHHLCQTLIPLAGAGLFLGLSSTTVSLLHADHVPLFWVVYLRIAILALATLWSITLAWRVSGLYAPRGRQLVAMTPMLLALALVNTGWVLFFWVW